MTIVWGRDAAVEGVVDAQVGDILLRCLLQAAPAGDAVDFQYINAAVFGRKQIDSGVIQLD